MSKLAKALTAAAGNAGGTLGYVEDVFSTYLYTGTGATQTITNGIDLAGEGGMVFLGGRGNIGSFFMGAVYDTERGATKFIRTNTTSAETTDASQLISFNPNGFSLGSDSSAWYTNYPSENEVSWTFRKAEKFFDVVTWTGDGTGARTISHNLNSTVGALFMKATNADMQWFSYHNGLTNAQFLELNATTSAVSSANAWNNTTPTSSEFTVGSYGNISGRTYVAYLFASDAGGFGDDGSESIIKCGSYTGDGTYTQFQDLGFEPQWILFKNASAIDDWWIYDSMRGLVVGGPDNRLAPNLSSAEAVTGSSAMSISATGFTPNAYSTSGQTYIYIAIRRPMKTPESGTEVFAPVNRTATAPTYYTGFVTDMQIMTLLNGFQNQLTDRLRGQKKLLTNATDAESAIGTEATYDWMTGVGDQDSASSNNIAWNFKRATGFFDVACHTSDGVTESYPHNLGVIPELKIIKNRGDGTVNWVVGGSVLGAPTNRGYYLYLNDSSAMDTNDTFFDQNDTASVYGVRSNNSSAGGINNNSYVVYLFATLAGVSKVGSYTGTGSTPLNVDCGFSSGARFVMIKRADGTGGWYVHDTARGIVAGNDSMLQLNSTAAEVTSNDYIDPYPSGFTVSNTFTGYNASGSTYIFLAIA